MSIQSKIVISWFPKISVALKGKHQVKEDRTLCQKIILEVVFYFRRSFVLLQRCVKNFVIFVRTLSDFSFYILDISFGLFRQEPPDCHVICVIGFQFDFGKFAGFLVGFQGPLVEDPVPVAQVVSKRNIRKPISLKTEQSQVQSLTRFSVNLF